jgi:hypothetical protein
MILAARRGARLFEIGVGVAEIAEYVAAAANEFKIVAHAKASLGGADGSTRHCERSEAIHVSAAARTPIRPRLVR